MRATRTRAPALATPTSRLSDLDAVTAGLIVRWNSGPAKGRASHLKTLKQQMFGHVRPQGPAGPVIQTTPPSTTATGLLAACQVDPLPRITHLDPA
jgi:hypothetical protein